MEAMLSPSYTHQKLDNPKFFDLVDVFEDIWRNCFFAPVDMLLKTPNGDIAAMTVLCSYFEAIASYVTGEDSNNRSKEFFVKGFCQVFRSDSPEINKAAEAIYKHIRCGLAHQAMLSHKVNYSRCGAKPFYLTYRKKQDGNLNFDAGVVSIMVNPLLFYQSALHHFDKYITELRKAEDQVKVKAFQNIVKRQWALGTCENIIGMTEAEFLGYV